MTKASRNVIAAVSVMVMLLLGCEAWALTVGGRNISAIPDIIRAARANGIITSNNGANLNLEKDSILRLHDDVQLDLIYNIGSGENASYIGKVNGYSTTIATRDNGLLASLAKTEFGGNKILIGSSKNLAQGGSAEAYSFFSNWTYDLYFTAVGKDAAGNITQSRFGAWRFPLTMSNPRYPVQNLTSYYLKDIKTGIFVDGFDGELIVVATMEVVNDNFGVPVNVSSKTAKVRLDFWALFEDEDGHVQYKKLDELNTTQAGFETAPLFDMVNAEDANWAARNTLNSTTASPYMLARVAPGDFNHDQHANELAVLTADKKNIKLTIYQIRYKDKKFSIRVMYDEGSIYSYSNPDYVTSTSYNGWSRIPEADVAAGDFDGDGKTELAVVFLGDIAAKNRSYMYYGGTAGKFHTYFCKWNNYTGKLDIKKDENVEPYGGKYTMLEFSEARRWHYRFKKKLVMPWGGFRAITTDINADGTDEVVIAGYSSELYESVDSARRGSGRIYLSAVCTYDVYPYLGLISMNSNRTFKPSDKYLWKGESVIKRNFELPGRNYDDFHTEQAFKLQEYKLAPVGLNETLYPFTDRELSVSTGPIFGTQGGAKPLDDAALRVYGGKMVLVKNNRTTLATNKTLTANGTSTLVAADFMGEGIELGTPTHLISNSDRSYTVILQASPYHVDNISVDGTALTTTPTNFSYVKGSMTSYERSSNSSQKSHTNFNITDSVETIFAIDSDATRSAIGAYNTFKGVAGYVKNALGFIPGVDKVTGKVSKVTGFLDNLIDKTEKIKQGFKEKVTVAKELRCVKAERLDSVQYVTADQNIWRYPVLTKPAPDWGANYSSVTDYVARQDYITFTLYDETKENSATDDSMYQPTHENGNLFSYPAAIDNIEGYSDRQKVLSGRNSSQFSTNTITHTLSFGEVSTNEETNSKKVSTGYITQGLSMIDGLVGTSLANVPKAETSPTYTRNESKEEKITLHLANADGVPLNLGYMYDYQAYVAANGAITCGFAVNKFDHNNNLFSPQSLYKKYTDPSFVLPYKFVLQDSTPQVPTFVANPNRRQAMSMRGVRFYAIDYNKYINNRLLAGARYRVEIPLYNASFVNVSGVKVKLYWVADREESALAKKTYIGESQAINMTGWADDGNNKAWALIDFTPSTTMSNDNFELYAEIDYSGQEVHKKRSATDPGGNNEGYFAFSVESFANRASSVKTAAMMHGTADDDDFVWPTITFGGYPTWKEFYNAKIANTDGPMVLDITLTNHMDLTLSDIEVKAIYIDEELLKEEETIEDAIGDACFAKNVILFPYETYTFSVTIDDDLADEFRSVGVDRTMCYYMPIPILETYYGVSIEDLLSGDIDPELEVFEAILSDDEEADIFVDRAITETYELIHEGWDETDDDTEPVVYEEPVCWRISGVGELFTDAEEYTAASLATLEDFVISWNPVSVGTAKTSTVALTISTIAGVTPKGNYAFIVQTSEDGETWDYEEAVTFSTESGREGSTTANVGTSSGGCDAGLAGVGVCFVLSLLILKRKES